MPCGSRIVEGVQLPGSSSAGRVKLRIKPVDNEAGLPVGVEYGIYVPKTAKLGDLDVEEEGEIARSIAAQVFKLLGVEDTSFLAYFVMRGDRCLYDSAEGVTQAVRLGPDEACMIFDVLSLAVDEGAEDFTEPENIARAVQVARKMLRIFCLETDKGRVFAEGTLEIMEEKYRESAGEDDAECLEDGDVCLDGDRP